MKYQPPEETDYSGIPLGGDDLNGGPVFGGDNGLPEVDEAQIGVIQEVPDTSKIPLAGDLLGTNPVFREENEPQEDIKEAKEESKEEEAATEEAGENSIQTQAKGIFSLSGEDISEDAKFTIDGEEHTAKDVLNIWNTRNRITQDFGKLSQLKETERRVNQQVGTLKERLALLDGTLEGQRKFYISAGMDPYKYEQSIREEIKQEVLKEQELSPEERAEERVRRIEEQREEERKLQEEQRSVETAKEQLTQYQQQIVGYFKITPEDMEQTYQQLADRVAEIKNGNHTPTAQETQYVNQISSLKGNDLIAAVGKLAWETKQMTRVNNIIDKIDPSIKNGDKYQDVIRVAFAEISSLHGVSEPSDEDLINLIKGRFNLEVATPNSDKESDPKEESEKSDGVEVVKEVPEAAGVVEESPISAMDLQSW